MNRKSLSSRSKSRGKDEDEQEKEKTVEVVSKAKENKIKIKDGKKVIQAQVLSDLTKTTKELIESEKAKQAVCFGNMESKPKKAPKTVAKAIPQCKPSIGHDIPSCSNGGVMEESVVLKNIDSSSSTSKTIIQNQLSTKLNKTLNLISTECRTLNVERYRTCKSEAALNTQRVEKLNYHNDPYVAALKRVKSYKEKYECTPNSSPMIPSNAQIFKYVHFRRRGEFAAEHNSKVSQMRSKSSELNRGVSEKNKIEIRPRAFSETRSPMPLSNSMESVNVLRRGKSSLFPEQRVAQFSRAHCVDRHNRSYNESPKPSRSLVTRPTTLTRNPSVAKVREADEGSTKDDGPTYPTKRARSFCVEAVMTFEHSEKFVSENLVCDRAKRCNEPKKKKTRANYDLNVKTCRYRQSYKVTDGKKNIYRYNKKHPPSEFKIDSTGHKFRDLFDTEPVINYDNLPQECGTRKAVYVRLAFSLDSMENPRFRDLWDSMLSFYSGMVKDPVMATFNMEEDRVIVEFTNDKGKVPTEEKMCDPKNCHEMMADIPSQGGLKVKGQGTSSDEEGDQDSGEDNADDYIYLDNGQARKLAKQMCCMEAVDSSKSLLDILKVDFHIFTFLGVDPEILIRKIPLIGIFNGLAIIFFAALIYVIFIGWPFYQIKGNTHMDFVSCANKEIYGAMFRSLNYLMNLFF